MTTSSRKWSINHVLNSNLILRAPFPAKLSYLKVAMTDSEASLVQRAQRGERAAFDELVRRTSRLVFARLHLDTGDVHLAEDLLQEALLTAFKSLGQLAEPDKFRAWLLRIAANTAANVVRHNRRQKRTPPSHAGPTPGPTPAPAQRLEDEERRQQVLELLGSLPEEYRLPLWLRYFGGADYETIQAQLGLTNGSLRGLLHRGLKMLREECARRGLSD
jgi:RNA polymerase sigma-70 factor (ECF subfamily)